MNDILTNMPDLALVLACAESEIPDDGTVITRTVNGRSIALSRSSPGEDTVVAFDSRCPHMQGPLKFGRVVNGEVICPWHFLRFNITTGETVTCAESLMHLQVFQVERSGGNIYVQMSPH